MINKRQNEDDLRYIKEICDFYEYPKGSFEALERVYGAIENSENARNVIFGWISAYENDEINTDEQWKALLSETAEAAKECGESQFTVHLLLLILMSPHMHELYRRAGIDDEIFRDSLADLKWKLNECIRMHGIVGTFVAHWHIGFYKMILFALGRLQFEIKKFGKNFSVCGVELDPDSNAVGVHIPSSGKLVREEYIASYAKAERFFSHLFPEGKTVFICSSWMLFPEHKVMLPQTSGIRIFAEDYTVVEAYYSKPGARPWPIFYEKQSAPADELPTSTSLERAYVERYKKGLPSGSAFGVMIYKDGQILNKERDKMA